MPVLFFGNGTIFPYGLTFTMRLFDIKNYVILSVLKIL